jgi:hypothetical protein
MIHKWISSDGSELVPTTDVKTNLTLPIRFIKLNDVACGSHTHQAEMLYCRRIGRYQFSLCWDFIDTLTALKGDVTQVIICMVPTMRRLLIFRWLNDPYAQVAHWTALLVGATV